VIEILQRTRSYNMEEGGEGRYLNSCDIAEGRVLMQG